MASVQRSLPVTTTTVTGYAEIQSDYGHPLTEQQDRDAEQIMAGGHRLLELINEVLDLPSIGIRSPQPAVSTRKRAGNDDSVRRAGCRSGEIADSDRLPGKHGAEINLAAAVVRPTGRGIPRRQATAFYVLDA